MAQCRFCQREIEGNAVDMHEQIVHADAYLKALQAARRSSGSVRVNVKMPKRKAKAKKKGR